jgi:hypothetical protein
MQKRRLFVRRRFTAGTSAALVLDTACDAVDPAFAEEGPRYDPDAGDPVRLL